MTRRNWILAGLLAVQVILIALLGRGGSQALEGKPLVPGLDPAKIMRIEIGTKPESRLVLTRAGNGWQIDIAYGYPADGAKVSGMLGKIREITAGEPVVTSSRYHESLDITEEKAQARVRLFEGDADKPVADLILGSAVSGGSHVRLANADAVFEAKTLSSWDADATTGSWMQRQIVGVSEADVSAIAVTNPSGTFALARAGERWVVSGPEAAKGKGVRKEKAEDLVRAVASLSADGIAGKLEMAAQGFAAPFATATITHGKDAQQITIRIGGHPADNASQVYVAKEGFPFAVTVWEASVSSLETTKLGDLLE